MDFVYYMSGLSLPDGTLCGDLKPPPAHIALIVVRPMINEGPTLLAV